MRVRGRGYATSARLVSVRVRVRVRVNPNPMPIPKPIPKPIPNPNPNPNLGLLERGALGRAVTALEECPQRRVAGRLLKPAQGMGLRGRLRGWGWG